MDIVMNCDSRILTPDQLNYDKEKLNKGGK